MKSFTCPSCGAQVDFKSSVTLYSVCAYCRSLILRRDMDVEALGKVAQLQEDASPFMLGTSGVYRSLPFTLIGRVVRGWSDGQWSEWFMLLHDQRRGWLAEAQGQLMVFLETDALIDAAVAEKWAVGESVRFANTDFSVTDIKETHCVGFEGELPVFSQADQKTTSIDLIAPPNRCATLELSGENRAENCVYIGEFVEFDACRFDNLRPLPGW